MKTELVEFERLLIEAHHEGARRKCGSTQVLLGTFQANGGDALKAIVAASMTFGGLHAPVRATSKYIGILYEEFGRHQDVHVRVTKDLNGKLKIPGFGSSFIKGRLDPQLKECHEFLHACFPIHSAALTKWEQVMKIQKDLYPNLAYFTAVFFRMASTPLSMYEAKLVEYRLPVWMELLNQQCK